MKQFKSAAGKKYSVFQKIINRNCFHLNFETQKFGKNIFISLWLKRKSFAYAQLAITR